MSASQWNQLSFTATQDSADVLKFDWRTITEGDQNYLQANAFTVKDNYFVDGKEFRVVLEWEPDSAVLTETTHRDARVGIYVPIEGGAFNAAGGTTRLVAEDFHGGGDSKNHAIFMVSHKKSESATWNQDANASGFQIDAGQTSLADGRG